MDGRVNDWRTERQGDYNAWHGIMEYKRLCVVNTNVSTTGMYIRYDCSEVSTTERISEVSQMPGIRIIVPNCIKAETSAPGLGDLVRYICSILPNVCDPVRQAS